MILLPPLAAEKLQNFFGVFLQFQIGVDTQEELAKLLNIDRSFLSSIESGKKGCSVDLFIQLAAFFQISLDELILGTKHDIASSREQVKDSISTLIDHLERFKASL